MAWNKAKRQGMDEVRGVHAFDEFVNAALLCALDLNGASFELRPLPQGMTGRQLIPAPLVLMSDEIAAHLERIFKQLFPHLTPEEQMLLEDPRTMARTFFMEGLRNMLD